MRAQLSALLWLTIRDPAEAALVLLGIPVSRNVGWQNLALGVVLNTLAGIVMLAVFPLPAEMQAPFLNKPLLYALVFGSVFVILVFSLFWGGRAIGGRGRFEDVLLAIGWLLHVRFVVQVASLLLMLAMPGFALIFVLGVGLYSIWVSLNFINVVHGFNSLMKAVLLSVITMVGMFAGMILLLSLVTATAIGMP
ncbi:hypothetical protein NBRC116594_01610 [Shimia sp. NS0008-38b]|uniref:YIP1 family protein n=1 Tax=Shimia sp. NS0008-38b TaxID=3127653 RepID=UPI0031082145